MNIIVSAKEAEQKKNRSKLNGTCPECGKYSPIEWTHETKEPGIFLTRVKVTTRHRCMKCGCIWEN